MKKHIVVINGTGGTGKEEFIKLCSKYAKVSSTSSIEKIKCVAKILGWSGEKTEKDRKFLADLKDISTLYNDMPYNDIKQKINEFNVDDNNILFIKLREPKEIKKLVLEYNVKTLLIRRKNHKQITSNLADKNVENYDYDYVIVNESMEKFDEAARKFVSEILQ